MLKKLRQLAPVQRDQGVNFYQQAIKTMEVFINDRHRAINIPLLILLIISFAVGIGMYFFQKSVNEEIGQTAINFLTVKSANSILAADQATNTWQTFRNEILGIEFKYPKELGTPEIEYKDYTIGNQKGLSGKAIEAFFVYQDSNLGFAFGAHSPDYQSANFKGFAGSNNIYLECPNELTYDSQGNVCKFIDVDSTKGIMENNLWEIGSLVGLGTRVIFNHASNPQYQGLEFYTLLADANNSIWSLLGSGAKNNNAMFEEAVIQSQNIMMGTNLSANDKKNLDNFLKVISTFRYLE